MKGGELNMDKSIKNEEEDRMGSWDGFLGSNFLDVEDVKTNDDVFVCVKVELDTENDRPIVIIQKDKITYKKSLNVTDSKFVHDGGIKTPNNLVGKKIFFKEVSAWSPSAKKNVPSLRIAKFE